MTTSYAFKLRVSCIILVFSDLSRGDAIAIGLIKSCDDLTKAMLNGVILPVDGGFLATRAHLP
jgi:hypothetical protein